MDIQSYLRRLNYTESTEPTVTTLQNLHLAHLYSVPFENLDIHLGNPITLELDKLFDKIVRRYRGGFCYELNGMFAWLLGELDFKVTLLSARDAHADGSFAREYDHLVLQVECPADPSTPSVSWLVDVGWGDTFRLPVRLDKPNIEQSEGARAYRIDQVEGYRDLWQYNDAGEWEKQYRFTLQPRQFAEFEPMCRYHQTSPESSFTQQRICTITTPSGRATLADERLIITEYDQRQERHISQTEYHFILENHFGIVL